MDSIFFDNIIMWNFDRIYQQIIPTSFQNEYEMSEYSKIHSKVYSDYVYSIINKITNKGYATIKTVIENNQFNFLFSKLKRKLDVKILLNYSQDDIISTLNYGCKPTMFTLKLCVVNKRYDIFKLLLDHVKINADILMTCAKHGCDEIYFLIRDKYPKVLPSLQIYDQAIYGNSLKILDDISQRISPLPDMLEKAHHINNNEVIKFLIKEFSDKKNFTYNKHLFKYYIMCANTDMINYVFANKLVDNTIWDPTLLHSALLSKSWDMIKLIEEHIPNIHTDILADSESMNKMKKMPIFKEIIYEKNKNTYFSHTLNYAIQSEHIDFIEYILKKQYVVTQSNVINAIKTGNYKITELIMNNFYGSLNNAIIYYFSLWAYVPNKYNLARLVLKNYNFTDLINNTLTMSDITNESTHIKILMTETVMLKDTDILTLVDEDYLLTHKLFFPETNNKYIRVVTLIRLFTELKLSDNIIKLFNTYSDLITVMCDAIFLFSDINFIRSIFLNKKIIISVPIISEIICRNDLAKLSFLINNNLISEHDITYIGRLTTMLSDPLIDKFMSKLNYNELDLSCVVESKNIQKIKDFIIKNPIIDNYDILKKIIDLDNLEIIKLINIPKKRISALIDYSDENEFFEIKAYLEKT